MPLEDLGLRMELLPRVEVEAGVSPEVCNRPRHEDSVALALHKEITSRGQAASTRAKDNLTRVSYLICKPRSYETREACDRKIEIDLPVILKLRDPGLWIFRDVLDHR